MLERSAEDWKELSQIGFLINDDGVHGAGFQIMQADDSETEARPVIAA